MKLALSQNTEFEPFDSSDERKLWLCTVTVDNAITAQITINETLYQFIHQFRTEQTLHQVLKTSGLDDQLPKFSKLVEHYLIPKGILQPSGLQDQEPVNHNPRQSHLKIRLPFLFPSLVNAVSVPLNTLFNLPLVMLLSLVGLGLQGHFLLSDYETRFSLFILSPIEQILVVLYIALGFLVHELGHAAAAYRYGCRNVRVGCGWYICFLVFYAELSEAWRLPRKQRLVIDFAGLYFQWLYTACLIALLMYQPSMAIYHAIIILNVAFLWNLNPFFRMDGYWIASDGLGISNLRRCANDLMRNTLLKLFGKDQEPMSCHYSTDKGSQLFFYATFSSVFTLFMVYFLGNRFIDMVLLGIPQSIDDFYWSLSSHQPFWALLTWSGKNLFNLLFLCFCGIFVLSLLRNGYGLLRLIRK